MRSRTLTTAAVLALATPLLAGVPIHVDDDAAPGGDGSTWATAYRHLQDALDVGGTGSTIKIAAGRYTPDLGGGRTAGDRGQSFRIPDGVGLRGGYAGLGAPDPDERDPEQFPSILSGDLAGDDGPGFANIADNSLHVVTISNTSPLTLLEHVVISGGNADGETVLGQTGAGVLGFGGNAVFIGCTITRNIAAFQGGGMQLKDGSHATLIDCLFSANRALDNGGALYNGESSPTLQGCTFIDNSGLHYAGGICNRDRSDALIEQCTFIGNTASEIDLETGGGAIVNASSSPRIIACTFEGNRAFVGRGGAVYNKIGLFPALGTSDPVIEQCVFSSNEAPIGGAIYSNDDSSPEIASSVFVGNDAGDGEGGAIWAEGGHMDVHDCFFTGNQGGIGGGGIWNEEAASAITSCTFDGNVAGTGAAIFNRRSPVLILDCTFTENHADIDLGGGGIWNETSNSFIADCLFENNTGRAGAGLYNVFESDGIVTRCTFRGNVAHDPTFGVGGGIGIYESSPLILGCSITGNRAALAGGGLYNENIAVGRPHYVNCNIVGNVAGNYGGGSYNFFSSPLFTNCTIVANRITDTIDPLGGGIMTHVIGTPIITGCLLWGNDGEQIDGWEAITTYSCIEGGYDGEGNIDADPLLLADAGPGPDGEWATDDDEPGDQRLGPGSPCIDAGQNTALPRDSADLDLDGDFTERTPLDCNGDRRFVDDPKADGRGCGPAATVDIGAFEFAVGSIADPVLVGDVNGDGDVNGTDLKRVLMDWGACVDACCPADTDHSGVVDAIDWLAVLADWGR